MQPSSPRRFWFDIEDLFEYSRTNSRPSGIQRVAFEIQRAMLSSEAMEGRVGFLRHAVNGERFLTVPWSQVLEIYERLSSSTASGHLETAAPLPASPSPLRRVALRLPPAMRVPLGQFLAHQTAALKAIPALTSGTLSIARQVVRQHVTGSDGSPFSPQPQDVILALGAPWAHPDYGRLIQHYRDHHDIRFGLLIHDIIPLLFPEWCSPGLPRVFKRWMTSVLPQCDQVFAVSDATRADLERQFSGLAPRTIRIGTALPATLTATGFSVPLPSRYVLSVGTFEARKNHLFLFRLWRRLLENNTGAPIPTLILAGSPGWLADDLLQQIRNSNFLDGHLIIARAPSDAQLNTLYQQALFTMVPSLYEGWGLPVSESLARGKICLASERGALSEAGQGLAIPFDPDNLEDALHKVREMAFDAAALAEAERHVVGTFRPTGWTAAALDIATSF